MSDIIIAEKFQVGNSFEEFTKSLAPIYRKMGRLSFGVVYLLLNMENGKAYIGQTRAEIPYERYWCHLRSAANGKFHPLYNAIRKYGQEAFKFETLASCDNQTTLDVVERYYIKIFNSRVPNGYNLQNGGKQQYRAHPISVARAVAVAQKTNRLPEVKERRRISGLRAMSDPIIVMRVKKGLAIANQNPIVKERRGLVTRGGTWITDGRKNKRIKPGRMIPDGWVQGRTGISEQIRAALNTPEEYQRRSKVTAGKLWINNGTINRRITPESEIPLGWTVGHITQNPLTQFQVAGRHTRWHLQRKINNPNCPLCFGIA